MLLYVLRHVEADQGVLVVEEELGQGAGQLGFAHAGWPQEEEGAHGALGIAQAGAGAADGVGDARQGFILADHAPAEALLHLDQLFTFAFQQAADRDASPLGDDAGDVFFVYFFFQHALPAFHFSEILLRGLERLLRFHQQPVTNFGHAVEVGGALGFLFFDFQLLDLFLEGADAGDGFLLGLPACLEVAGTLALLGQVFLDFLQALARVRVVFFLQRLALDFGLENLPLDFVNLGRHRVNLDAERSGSLVHQVQWPCRAGSGRRCSGG